MQLLWPTAPGNERGCCLFGFNDPDGLTKRNEIFETRRCSETIQHNLNQSNIQNAGAFAVKRVKSAFLAAVEKAMENNIDLFWTEKNN